MKNYQKEESFGMEIPVPGDRDVKEKSTHLSLNLPLKKAAHLRG